LAIVLSGGFAALQHRAGAVEVAAKVAVAPPSFTAKVKDHQSPHVRTVRHGSTVSLFGSSTGSFSVMAGHGPGSLPSEFRKGRYSEKYVMFSLIGFSTYHYHNLALLKFSNKRAGSACFLLNGPANQTANTVTVKFSALGGTGDGGKLRMSGTATADVFSSPLRLTAHGKVTLGKSRPLSAKCRHA
jgi:hypothetical protein